MKPKKGELFLFNVVLFSVLYFDSFGSKKREKYEQRLEIETVQVPNEKYFSFNLVKSFILNHIGIVNHLICLFASIQYPPSGMWLPFEI